ncbi:translation initiation factor 2 [Pseudomonas sp. TNT2022 ID1044]|uniref:translation initiation factor 2 n=1 Tax=Pseudomonas sp. TNT2022 ID1044 TaxID=2942636 RepID=UPI00235F9EF9|nr:translation initiation factor 2 [Pseudomonas sp. TNT2022 ID1044]MDD0998654.1 translation initiation factor 2 [Pseudomonas sp. TNT2022 ID1044]
MKPNFPAAWLLVCLLISAQPGFVMAASAQEKPAASTPSKKKPATQQTVPAKKKPAAVKKRPPIASKSKPASEVAKTQLPSTHLDLSLPKDMVEELDPVGTVPLPKREPVLPQMFGDKSSQFQLNGRLISNEMQLQLRNEERHEVEGAALEFEFKR